MEELSVRYKKQIEDLQISVRQAHDAIAAAAVLRQEDRKDIEKLMADLRDLKLGVEDFVAKLEAVGTWVSDSLSESHEYTCKRSSLFPGHWSPYSLSSH